MARSPAPGSISSHLPVSTVIAPPACARALAAAGALSALVLPAVGLAVAFAVVGRTPRGPEGNASRVSRLGRAFAWGALALGLAGFALRL